MSVICDSYFDESYDTVGWLFYAGSWLGLGQSFSGNGGKLETAQFYMMHSNNATGNAYAYIWNIMWTFGSSAVPLYGSDPIATSDAVDVTTIADARELVTFTFSGANQIILGATTKYCLTIAVETESVHPDYLYIYGHHIDPTHPGNQCSRSVGFPWGYDANKDMLFYVYTGDTKLQDIIGNNSIIPIAR